MKQKVLIATYYWPPSGGPGVQRYLKFAKYLSDFDIEPIILTVDNPTYPIRDSTLSKEIPENLLIYKSRTIEPFGFYAALSGNRAESITPTIELEGDTVKSILGSWIRANIFIPDARAGWLITAKKKAAGIIRKHDIHTVITTGPPHSVHFIGKHLQQKENIRWLADFRDPWSGIYYNKLLPRTSVAKQMDEKMEVSILSEADEVIVVSRTQAENFRQIVERGYRVITNGFDPEDFESIAEESPNFTHPQVSQRKFLQKDEHPDIPDLCNNPDTDNGNPEKTDEFLIRHIGNIGEAAVPVALLKAVSRLKEVVPLRFEFIGYTHPKLPELVRQMNLEEQVVFQEYLPHYQALKKMCEADALLLSIPDVDSIEHHIPGKLFEYLGSGRPILMIGPENGECAAILREQHAGIATGFGDPEAIKEALLYLKEGGIKSRTVSRNRNHPYSRYILTQTLSRLITAENLY